MLVFSCGMIWVQHRRLGKTTLLEALQRLILRYTLFWMVATCLLQSVRQGEWGRAVSEGRALMRPFPPVRVVTNAEQATISSGPTTFPNAWDVLIGTRFDTHWLGTYEHWLEGHPGNTRFLASVHSLAPLYATSCQGDLPAIFCDSLINTVIESIHIGRFLQQDYRNGDWRVQTAEETKVETKVHLAKFSSRQMKELITYLDRSIAQYRFGTLLRTSTLARNAAVYAWEWKHQLVRTGDLKDAESGIPQPKSMVEQFTKQNIPSPPPLKDKAAPKFVQKRKDLLGKADPPTFDVGYPVWFYTYNDEDGGTYLRGDILDMSPDGEFVEVATESGEIYSDIPVGVLARYQPVEEGDIVESCYPDGCFEGQVLRVMADEAAAIYYEDDDYQFRVPAGRYHVPPFNYVAPDEEEEYEEED